MDRVDIVDVQIRPRSLSKDLGAADEIPSPMYTDQDTSEEEKQCSEEHQADDAEYSSQVPDDVPYGVFWPNRDYRSIEWDEKGEIVKGRASAEIYLPIEQFDTVWDAVSLEKRYSIRIVSRLVGWTENRHAFKPKLFIFEKGNPRGYGGSDFADLEQIRIIVEVSKTRDEVHAISQRNAKALIKPYKEDSLGGASRKSIAYRHLVDVVYESTKDHICNTGMGQDDAEDLLLEVRNLLTDIRYSFSSFGSFQLDKAQSDNEEDFDVDVNLLDASRGVVAYLDEKKEPYIDRHSLGLAVENYLNLPFRVKILDKYFTRWLIAMEGIAFAREMLDPVFGRLTLSTSRRLRDGYLGHIGGQAALVALVLGVGYVAIRENWISEAWMVGIGSIVIALIGLNFLRNTIALPSTLRRARNLRTSATKQLELIEIANSGVTGDGSFSARHVRRLLTTASDSGVVWPGALFALLDDIEARQNRELSVRP